MKVRSWQRAVPLALAVLLVLGGCEDDEEKKKKIVDVQIDKDTELRIRVREEDKDEMIIVGELALFATLIVWALFGPGATRRRPDEAISENR